MTKREPLNLVGAIGKRPCEISLQNILHELGDRKVLNRVMNCILDFRDGLRQFTHVPDIAWRKRFTYEWRSKFFDKVFKGTLPTVVQTHLWCCMTAYYRDHMMLIYNAECSHESKAERVGEG